jgi:hypothetical protein
MFFTPNSDHDFPVYRKNQDCSEIACKLQHRVDREALMRAEYSIVGRRCGIAKLCGRKCT